MDKRPWLTLAIDVFTRMVVGFHLSMDKPSRVSLRLCMLNAVYDRAGEGAGDRRVVAGRRIARSCAMWTPAPIFAAALFPGPWREEGIKVIFRPPGAPHYGGHIERLIACGLGGAVEKYTPLARLGWRSE